MHAESQLPRRAHPTDRLLLAAHGRRRGVDTSAPLSLQRAHDCGAGTLDLRWTGRDLPTLLGVELLAGDEPGGSHGDVDAGNDGVPAGPRRRPSRDAAL